LISLDQYESEVSFIEKRALIHMGARIVDGTVQLGKIVGYSIDGTKLTDPSAVKMLDEYFAQMHVSGPDLKWVPDVFQTLGLC
jgi:hypothetical protein